MQCEINLSGGGKTAQPLKASPSIVDDDKDFKAALALSLVEQKQLFQQHENARKAIVSQLPAALRYEQVLGDGTCLFRALHLGISQYVPNPPAFTQIRAVCVQAIETLPELKSRFFNEEDFSQYVNSMKLDGTYGDELCLHAFSKHYKIKVTVFTAEHGQQVFASQNPGKEVFLAHNGINHFDAVLLRQPPRPFLHHPVESHNVESVSCSPVLESLPKIFSDKSLCSKKDSCPTEQTHDQDVSNTIKILSINVNSWLRHRDNLLDKADIVVTQETRLTAAGQRSNTKFLRKKNMHSVHGAPCPPVIFSRHGKEKYANSSTATGRQSGVAIFSHSPWVTLPCVCVCT